MSGTCTAVLQHSFHDGVRAFAVVNNLLFIRFNVFCERFYFLEISLIGFLFQFFDQFTIDFRKVVHKIQGVLNFMGDSCRQFSERGHFLCVDQLGLSRFQFTQRLIRFILGFFKQHKIFITGICLRKGVC